MNFDLTWRITNGGRKWQTFRTSLNLGRCRPDHTMVEKVEISGRRRMHPPSVKVKTCVFQRNPPMRRTRAFGTDIRKSGPGQLVDIRMCTSNQNLLTCWTDVLLGWQPKIEEQKCLGPVTSDTDRKDRPWRPSTSVLLTMNIQIFRCNLDTANFITYEFKTDREWWKILGCGSYLNLRPSTTYHAYKPISNIFPEQT